MNARLFALTGIAAAALTAASAEATTYSSGPLNGIAGGGFATQPTAADAYGQFFTVAAGGILNSVQFTDTDTTNTSTQLVIQAFNTSNFTSSGVNLFQGSSTVSGFGDGSNSDGSDFFYNHTFTSNAGVVLAPGTSYVAYLVDSPGVDTFNGQTSLDDSAGDGNPVLGGVYYFAIGRYATALGGAEVYRSGGTFTQTTDATPGHDPHFQALYSFDITAAPAVSGVPEPASWATMVGGFGLVGGAVRRRNRAAALA